MTGARTVRIIVRIPEDSNANDVVIFAVDALTSWGGQFHPDDPLFHSLRVKSISAGGFCYALSNDGRELVTELVAEHHQGEHHA